MPWQENSELPSHIKDALPEAAQTRFRMVANGLLKEGINDKAAVIQAWSVVGTAWRKPKAGGKWVRKVYPKPEGSPYHGDKGRFVGTPNYGSGVGSQVEKIKPRTLYICRYVQNPKDIISWAKEQGFPHALEPDDLHVTIAYSRNPIDWMKIPDEGWNGDQEGNITVKPGGARVVEPLGDKGAVVLLFKDERLAYRHKQIRDIGASWDHQGYQPHVTITWDATGVDLSKVEPYTGEIVLGPEIFAEVNDNWSDNITEKFDSSKHPRDDKGRFAGKDGSSEFDAFIKEWSAKNASGKNITIKDFAKEWNARSGKGTDTPAEPEQKSRIRKIIDGYKAYGEWKSNRPVLGFFLDYADSVIGGMAILAGWIAIGAVAYNRGFGRKGSSSRYDQRDKDWYDRARAERAKSGTQSQETHRRSTAKTVETAAEAEVRVTHGLKAAKLLTMYLRATTPSEKEAAKAALAKMGVDVSKLAKAVSPNPFDLLDEWITEEEAEALLEVFMANLSAEDAQKIIDGVAKEDNTIQKMDVTILKVDKSLGLVFGYAIICKKDGKDYYDLNIDKDTGRKVPEHIPEGAMLEAAIDFAENSRVATDMHKKGERGSVPFIFPMTSEIAKALGIDTATTGLLIAMKPDKEMLAKFESGDYRGFSIGGRRIQVEDLMS